jgi:hypothetical protein
MAIRVSPNAIQALQDALVATFWRKKDLLAYLRAAVEDEHLLQGIDWLSPDAYKRESVSQFVNRLAADQGRHRDLVLRLMSDVAAMDDFPQLAWLEDGPTKIKAAQAAVERLRRYMTPYEEELAEKVAAQNRITQARREAEIRRATSDALRELTRRYYTLLAMESAQRRGFAFERWLRELFDVFDLDPKASLRAEGEQIDGGFTLHNHHYLLEARWRKVLAAREDLDVFDAKVRGHAENTLGLYISVEGFEPTAISRHSHRGSPLILMHGGDLLDVLEERITLDDLIARKYRHASMTGEILLSSADILRG